jgi:CHAD domain-containing protein
VLREQARLAAEAARGLLTGEDPELLHDLRVALRRYRAALRVFRPVLPRSRVRGLRRELARHTRALGPARDFQVRLQTIRAYGEADGVEDRPEWRRFVRPQESRARQVLRRLRKHVQTASWQRLMERMPLSTAGASDWGPMAEAIPAGPFLSKRLRRDFRRLRHLDIDRARLRVSDWHDVRKQVRRVRYLAEAASPYGPRTVARRAVQLAGLTHALGCVHDADVQLEWLASEALAPKALCRRIREARARAEAEFRRRWTRLQKDRA